MKSPLMLRLLNTLLDDFKRDQPDVKGLDRDKVTIKARFEHEGAGFFTVALPALCDAVDLALAKGRFACPTGLQCVHKGALPKLFSGLLCKVFDKETGLLKEAPDLGATTCLRQASRLFKKFALTSKRDRSLDRDARRTFWEHDDACQLSVFDGRRVRLLSHVAGVLLSELDTLRYEEILPKHGPGAVSEKVVANQKWFATVNSLLAEEVDLTGFGLDVFAALERAEIHAMGGRGLHQSTDEVHSTPHVRLQELSQWRPTGKSARLVSVPKNSVSRRTITVEPLMNMFIQQGLNTELRRVIERDSVLCNSLALTDQSENQKLALEGSRTGEWSTIDLSAASDRLSLELVKIVFAAHPGFLARMLDCRSETVMDRSPRPLGKFAGMGNALTFPVQSVVFAALAYTAICEAEGRSRPSRGMLKRIARRVRVYGDDIIVRTDVVHLVMDWIESFGLKINRKKTFTEGNFRESCGLDAFRGHDVTPVYVSDDPESSRDIEGIQGLVAASNLLWLRGFYLTATELANHVESLLGCRLPIVGRNSGALGWVTRIDSCAYQKWDEQLQRLVYRAPVVVSKTTSDPLDGYPALLKFFLTPLIQRDKEHLKRSVRRYQTRIVWRWKPTQVG